MKKGLALLIVAVFLCGTASASNIGVEALWNKVFNSSDNTIKAQVEPYGGVVSGLTSDSHANSNQPLSKDSVAVKMVIIRADEGNQGSVYIGSSATATSGDGLRISNDAITIPVDDVQDIYFDADNAGDTITWLGVQ